jgi:hypothetical protein
MLVLQTPMREEVYPHATCPSTGGSLGCNDACYFNKLRWTSGLLEASEEQSSRTLLYDACFQVC